METPLHNHSMDLLFPSRAIETLGKLRGEKWEKLISNLVNLDPASLERTAFVLFMVRLGGCATCQSDSFRAMRGCVICSSNTIKRYKGKDQNLIDLYNEAKKEMSDYMNEVR